MARRRICNGERLEHHQIDGALRLDQRREAEDRNAGRERKLDLSRQPFAGKYRQTRALPLRLRYGAECLARPPRQADRELP